MDSAVAITRRRAAASVLPRLMVGVLMTALLLMLQQVRLGTPYHRTTVPMSGFSRLIELPQIQVPQPSPEFEKELAMTPKELLDRWNPLVEEAARKFHIPPAWLRAVMRRESGGRTLLKDGSPIVSPVGAMGVMQLMPGTYNQMAKQYQLGNDPFNPRDNVFAAAGYLRWLHGKYGFPAMFAAYNDGPGNYEDHLHGRALPLETRNYLKAMVAELGVRLKIKGAGKSLRFTRPDGSKLAIDPADVDSVRAVFPGEYAPSVHAVISMGHERQGVRESVARVTERLRRQGVRV